MIPGNIAFMSGGNEEDQLAQCQAYVQRHNVQQLVKEAIGTKSCPDPPNDALFSVVLCIHKPDNPVLFLKDHFEKLNEQRSQVSWGS